MTDEYIPDLSLLTIRERSIVALLADGTTLEEVAGIFGVKRDRIVQQQRDARRKLGATTDEQWQAVFQASRSEA
jgi:DNA-binding CsgD family transcriptional regulator